MVKSKATQDFVPIREVRDGVIVLQDGSLRGVVEGIEIDTAHFKGNFPDGASVEVSTLSIFRFKFLFNHDALIYNLI